MYLVEKIIEKSEKSTIDWRHGISGGRSLNITQEMYDVCGKTKLLQEAKQLEQIGLIWIGSDDWVIRGSDIKTIRYRVERLDEFYELSRASCGDSGRLSKQQLIWKYQNILERELENITADWIRQYYRDLLNKLDEGKIPKILQNIDIYLSAFRGIDKLKEPMFKRLFSKKYLKNSKTFENSAEEHIVSIAKMYCEDVEAEMSKTEVLSQIFIEEYSQEMAVKGPLSLCFYSESEGKKQAEQDVELDLSKYIYGTVLNSETLKNAVIRKEQSQLKRVITIENKANFISAPYCEDTLYIFSHGYFSPRERLFLQKLAAVLEEQETEFYHSGDLDYGGVKIYEYIKNKIFKKLRPWDMDVQTYEKCLKYGETIEKEILEKLEKANIPDLQDLINKILETKLGIEQECFLL